MTELLTEELELSVVDHAEFHIEKENIVSREISSKHDRDTANSDLIRMSVKAFGWEVNRNGFMHKKKVLKKSIVDAFGEKLPMYRTFEGKLVDRNHKMSDSGARTDEAIGYIESAYMKEDGVYFDMWVWKRCISEDEQRQIRDSEVSVSMEVDFTNPVVILNGEELPSTLENRRKKGAIRSMADDALVNGLGIAVLFDGIAPGYASSKVVETENAVLDVTNESAEDTVLSNKERGSEAANAETVSQEDNNMQELETAKAELAAANEALAAKGAEIEKLYEELNALRVQQFNDAVSANFDLGSLDAATASWLLDMIRWSGCPDETAKKLVGIAACVKTKPTEMSAVDEPAAVVEEPAAVVEDAPAAVTEDASSVNVAVDDPAAVEPEPLTAPVEPGNPTNDPEGASAEVETATAVNIASGASAQLSSAPRWEARHF